MREGWRKAVGDVAYWPEETGRQGPVSSSDLAGWLQ